MLIFTLVSAQAHAQTKPTRSTIRVLGPSSGIEIGDNQVKTRPLINLVAFGLELSHIFSNGWTSELSAISVTDGSNFGHTLALRGGKTFPVHEKRAIYGHLFPFAGYRYAPRPDYNHDGRSDFHDTHNLQFGLGYDVQTTKTGRAVLRLTLGTDLVLVSRFRLYYNDTFDPGYRSTRYNTFINASLGLAFDDLF